MRAANDSVDVSHNLIVCIDSNHHPNNSSSSSSGSSSDPSFSQLTSADNNNNNHNNNNNNNNEDNHQHGQQLSTSVTSHTNYNHSNNNMSAAAATLVLSMPETPPQLDHVLSAGDKATTTATLSTSAATPSTCRHGNQSVTEEKKEACESELVSFPQHPTVERSKAPPLLLPILTPPDHHDELVLTTTNTLASTPSSVTPDATAATPTNALALGDDKPSEDTVVSPRVPPLPSRLPARRDNQDRDQDARSEPTSVERNHHPENGLYLTLETTLSSEVSELGLDISPPQQQQPTTTTTSIPVKEKSSRGGGGGGDAVARSSSSSRRHRHRHENTDEDDDSSNDDSSYFADPSNLPSPKSSHRRYSHSSLPNSNNNYNNNIIMTTTTSNHGGGGGGSSMHASLGGGIPMMHSRGDALSRESDASLSLSSDDSEVGNRDDIEDEDDDDDDGDDENNLSFHNSNNIMFITGTHSQQQQPNQLSNVTELYPHPLTRMHSVSSLVSTSSQCSSNTDVPEDELQGVLTTDGRVSTGSSIPSGRLSPILGQHPPSRHEMSAASLPNYTSQQVLQSSSLFASPMTCQPSPPTILAHFSNANNHMMMNAGQGGPPGVWSDDNPVGRTVVVAHPQPHHQMTPDEMAQWMAAGAAAAATATHPIPPLPYSFHTNNKNNSHRNPEEQESPLSKEEGSKESWMCYSEDSEGMMSNSNLFLLGGEGQPASMRTRATGSNLSGGVGPSSGMSNQGPGGGSGGHESDNGGGGGGQGVSRNGQGSGSGGFPGGNHSGQYSSYQHPPPQKVSFHHQSTSKSNEDDRDKSGRGYGPDGRREGLKVYWQRWIMLFYMSLLNLLSDWTCYSVAPIAVLTKKAFGNIDPEQLVTVFLSANAIASASEPILLSRLGLRRTVLFGALLLMIGSIVKSGGMPPIIQAELVEGHGEWRVYLGFFLVGLSQPLYQCTPALLSASWFPERERTMATGVALNANQLGIGFAFIFGTLLVETSDDIPGYFSFLSIISTLTFMGVLCQFDDAPPTPPSETARVIRGTLDVRLPSVRSIFESVRSIGNNANMENNDKATERKLQSDDSAPLSLAPSASSKESATQENEQSSSGKPQNSKSSKTSGKKESSPRTSKRKGRPSRNSPISAPAPTLTRQRSGGSRTRSIPRTRTGSESNDDEGFHGLISAPSPANWQQGSVFNRNTDPGFPGWIPPSPANWEFPSQPSSDYGSNDEYPISHEFFIPAPSPMLPGNVGAGMGLPSSEGEGETSYDENPDNTEDEANQYPPGPGGMHQFAQPGQVFSGDPLSFPYAFQQLGRMPFPQGQLPRGQESAYEAPGYPAYQGAFYGTEAAGQYGSMPPYAPPGYMPQPYWDPRYQQYMYHTHQAHRASPYQPLSDPYFNYRFPQQGQSYLRAYEPFKSVLPEPAESVDVGAEPVLTLTPHHLDIDIRDDQVLLSIRACLARSGFIHSLVSFTVSGIVINTLSTFMDYLVRLNGVGREYTGIVGGSFQFVIMVSSLIVGQFTDRTRAYYSVTVGMLVLGAFALAECGVSLDSDKGVELRWSLIVVAALVGPLQPVSTELGVDVVYPLSENTVLVIQQLFANLLSALFIPCFKAFKDFGGRTVGEGREQPEYTFSFYLLIILHAAATVFFATFNGRYLRYEHELLKKEQEEEREIAREHIPLLSEQNV